tara:strand:- start:143 stop:643 length:501 start_codon:yes stop_codon:yes gene_type:complete
MTITRKTFNHKTFNGNLTPQKTICIKGINPLIENKLEKNNIEKIIQCLEHKPNQPVRVRKNEIDYTFSLAKMYSRNPGYVYVKKNKIYIGKISPKGVISFWKIEIEEEIKTTKELNELIDDLENSIITYGRKTGRCSRCNKKLKRKESIERGIGPECGNWTYKNKN